MMALLAGLGAGYLGLKEKERTNKREDAQEQRAQEEFDMRKAEYEQKKADRDAVREAATPVAVTEDQGPPTESQVAQARLEGRQPGPVGYRVGNGTTSKVFAERGIADTAASQQNTVDGTRTRTAAAMAAQGNVLGADQLRTSGIQASAAELALKEGQQTAADKAMKRRIDGFKTPEDMAAFMTESPADKLGGEFKAQASYSPDKKTFTFDRLNADGTVTPTGQVFENSPTGMEKAKMTLAGYMTPEQRMAHHQWEETKAETARHNKATEDVAKQNANTQEQYRKDMAANQRAMTAARIAAGGAGGGASGSATPSVSLKDRRDFLSDAASFLEDTKLAGSPVEAAAMQQRNEQTLAHADAIFSTNAEFGNVLTAPQARAAMQLAQDPKNVRTIRDNNTGQYYETVQVNGKGVILGVGTMKKPTQSQANGTEKPPAPPRVSAPVDTAIPMSYYDRAGGDAAMARKLMADDQDARLNAALKQTSVSSVSRKFMPKDQPSPYNHRTSEGQK